MPRCEYDEQLQQRLLDDVWHLLNVADQHAPAGGCEQELRAVLPQRLGLDGKAARTLMHKWESCTTSRAMNAASDRLDSSSRSTRDEQRAVAVRRHVFVVDGCFHCLPSVGHAY